MQVKKYKIIYITNQACFHDIGFIDVFFKHYKNDFDFTYLTTEKSWDEQRLQMGYETLNRDYIICSKDLNDEKLVSLFAGVDTLCVGSNNDQRIKKLYGVCNNVVFCTEHLSKANPLKNFLSSCKYFYLVNKYFGNKPKYLLSYSYHAIDDYKRFGFNSKNLFLFGYFPKLDYATSFDIENKNKYKALWCGRLVDFKRVERAIFAIKYLHNIDSKYELTIIGDGPQKNKVLSYIKKNNADYVKLYSFQSHDFILNKMKESGLFLFTSDKGEGWGVVLNEAMSQGCVCICSAQAGSTKVLQINKESGLIFKNNRTLKEQLIYYNTMDAHRLKEMSLNAVERIKIWSNNEAGIRLGLFLKEINDNKAPSTYSDGPISYKKL